MNKLQLPSVTAFCIDRNDTNGAKRAVDIATKSIDFGCVILITEHDYFVGREGYSRFCIKDMYKFIKTDFVLTLHSDGYPQRPEAWSDDWLQYDYIGGLWDWYNIYQNGNGGFSLRSKKLLDILSKLDLPNYHPEDDVICRQLRPMLEEKYGIKFAPNEVCKLFSIEGYGLKKDLCRYDGEFGFHGYHVQGLPIPPTPKIPTVKTPITFQKNTIPKNTHKRTFKR